VSNRDGNSEIYTCKADGSGIRRLTNNPATDDEPAWSPDGTKIVFTSDRTGSVEVYIMNADGTGVQRLTSLNSPLNENLGPAWSPDGTLILFSALNNGTVDIFLVGAPGSSMPMNVLYGTIGWEGQPAWSPDGKRIAFTSDMDAYDSVLDIYIMNADGTGVTALTQDRFDRIDYLSATWSPDGTRLAVGVLKAVGLSTIVTQIGLMKPDGTGLVILGDVSAGTAVMSWAADGQRIYYTSSVIVGAGTRKDIAWISANGSSRGTLLTNGWNAQLRKR
jgi:Tol biopolymer transport system component